PGENGMGLVSTLYSVSDDVIVDAIISHYAASERSLALEHLYALKALIALFNKLPNDRLAEGYCSVDRTCSYYFVVYRASPCLLTPKSQNPPLWQPYCYFAANLR
ncbi:hypothetical protein, partial [Dialister sp.]|uniref:hypothetical protein n=1 Tax=Dialister sp. TaxID=1955814 RepID=UPI002E8223DD